MSGPVYTLAPHDGYVRELRKSPDERDSEYREALWSAIGVIEGAAKRGKKEYSVRVAVEGKTTGAVRNGLGYMLEHLHWEMSREGVYDLLAYDVIQHKDAVYVVWRAEGEAEEAEVADVVPISQMELTSNGS